MQNHGKSRVADLGARRPRSCQNERTNKQIISEGSWGQVGLRKMTRVFVFARLLSPSVRGPTMVDRNGSAGLSWEAGLIPKGLRCAWWTPRRCSGIQRVHRRRIKELKQVHRYKLCFIATALSAGLRSYSAVGRGVFKEMNVSLRDGCLWVFGGRRWSPRAALFVILARVVVEFRMSVWLWRRFGLLFLRCGEPQTPRLQNRARWERAGEAE